MAASISRKVSGKITNLAVTRDGMKIKATWKIPSYMTDQERGDRATYLDQDFDFVPLEGSWKPESGEVWNPEGAYPGPPEKTYDFTDWDYYWVKGFGLATTVEKPFKRSRYYPLTSKKVEKAAVAVHGGNGLDAKGGRGPKVWCDYVFQKPRKPTVTWVFNASNSTATVTVETDPGKDNQERYDTMVFVEVRKADGKTATIQKWTSTTATKWTKEVQLSSYLSAITEGKYVTVTCKCYARGIYGDSEKASASRIVGKPAAAAISKVTVDKKEAGGTVRAAVSASWLASSVKLQRRHGESGSWEDVSGAVDDSNVKALYDSYTSADPVAGEYIYYRTVSTRDNFVTEGEAKRADCLFTAKLKPTCTATVGIVKLAPDQSGTSCTATVGFTDSTANGGTELSWSSDRAAWDSTDGPSTSEIAGSGSAATGAYKRQQSKVVTSLASGVTYYVRARRYREVDGERIYSKYSSVASFTTESAADDGCAVVECGIDNGGTRATVVVGIDEDNDNTGTELTWADHADAWTSNEQPEALEATWAVDDPRKSADWGKTHTVHLRGLVPGKTYYVKARRFLDPVSGSRTYTDYSKVYSFTTPSTASSSDVRCGLVSVVGGDDGHSAKAVVGWSGDRSGCELSWSKDPDAWESAEQPATLEFAWADGESQSAEWAHTATAFISGLDEGETYYVRARSYYEGSVRVWSDYAEAVEVASYSAPSNVSLTAPSAVARGDAIEAWWTVENETPQVEWHIHEDGKPFASIAEGEGSLCVAKIAPERYGDAGSIDFYVEVGCGGGLAASNTVSVGIADRPECGVHVASALTAQPLSFEAACDMPGTRLLATCRSLGVTVSAPDGDRDQLAGDVVWTRAVDAAWDECTWADTAYRADLASALADAQAAVDAMDQSDEGYADAVAARDAAQAALDAHPADGTAYKATVTLPDGVDFADGGGYELSVAAVEGVAGLSSEEARAAFSVAWAHQAPAPSGSISVVPDVAQRSVTVTLAAPSGAASGDVYDVYRKTPEGHVLVGWGLALDAEVVDPYAPFGRDAELSYRICTRTADGDMEFADYAYEMDVTALRFDWDGGSVELPYNVELSEGYSKDFEARAHMDGSVNGYWNRAVEMGGSYSTDVIRYDDLSQVEAVRALARHPGAVFCRTADGMAFQCDAEVGDIGSDYSSRARGSVRVRVTAVRTTEEFMLQNGRGGD